MLILISGFNICSSRTRTTASKPAKYTPRISKFILKNTGPANDYSFANEALPSHDAGVARRLKHSLFKHNYLTIQSDILQSKADRLFPILEPILKAYGIPDDFKYIPLVESGLREGTSARGAKGLWQFMPGTARTYGLTVAHGIDERQNVRKSTVAACKYIRELYTEFNSWTLAAAAYNNGSVKMEKAISRQNEDNYFRMHLNRETGAYVYNLIAMKAIISEPKKYGYDYYRFKSCPPGPVEFLAMN